MVTVINMNFNLYPYNYWILYLSIAMVVVFLILLLTHALKLLKTLGSLQIAAQSLQTRMDHINADMKILQKKRDPLPVDPKKVLAAWLLFRAIRKEYKNTPERGIKGISKSTVKVLEKRNRTDSIQKEIRKIL